MSPRNPASIAAVDLAASADPGETTLLVTGVERRIFDDVARGAPFGPDDGPSELHQP